MTALPLPPHERFPLATWLRQQREARDLNQAQLAKASGTTASNISKIEQKERWPSQELFARLLVALGVPAAQYGDYALWYIGLQAAPPTAQGPSSDEGEQPPVPGPPPAATSADTTYAPGPASTDLADLEALADMLRDRLLPDLENQVTNAAEMIELRILGRLIQDRALAQLEAVEQKANAALQLHSGLVVLLGVMLGLMPHWVLAGLAVITIGVSIWIGMEPWLSFQQRRGLTARRAWGNLFLSSLLVMAAVAQAIFAVRLTFPFIWEAIRPLL